MDIGDGIINKGGVFYVVSYTYPGNNIQTGTGWVNKLEKCNNGFTTMSVNLDVDGFIYPNIPLKDVSKVDVLNIM